jgi:tetratricopeptide (TPR) repeat protein
MTLGFAALGIAPDLDLIVGAHRGPTHSVGAVVLVALATWFVVGRQARRGRWTIACAAAYGSHLLLDWFGLDTSAPFGIPALWPLSSAYFQAPWPVFLPVSRRIHQPDLFWIPNALAVARELLILVPIVMLVASRRRRTSRRLGNGVVAAAIAMLSAGAAVERLSARQPLVDSNVERQTQDAPRKPDVDGRHAQERPYGDAVARYLNGEFKEALAALVALPAADIKTQERDLKRDPSLIQAAIMLHTEAAQAAGLDDPVVRFHFGLAHQLLIELRRIQPSGEFERGWYLLASAVLQGGKNDADEMLDEARGHFPRDPELLVSTGAAFELRTFVAGDIRAQQFLPTATRTFDPDADMRRALQSAARYLSEAATLAPESDESHLRLGRVLHRLGQIDRAAAELDLVRGRAVDGTLKYLAALFQASLESARHRPERAADLYLEALATVTAQSALVGLSHAYYEMGRGEEAGRALQNVFRLPSNHPDPWFSYMTGDAWHADTRLKAMRALVTRPPVIRQ